MAWFCHPIDLQAMELGRRTTMQLHPGVGGGGGGVMCN